MSDPASYPPPAFAFAVGIVLLSADAGFQEASGIEAAMEPDDAVEGGANRQVHRLPGVDGHGNLVLKRGYVMQGSALAGWAAQTLGSALDLPVATQDLFVALLGPDGAPLVRWHFAGAWPVKWVTAGLDDGTVLTEVLEIAYSHFTHDAMGPA